MRDFGGKVFIRTTPNKSVPGTVGPKARDMTYHYTEDQRAEIWLSLHAFGVIQWRRQDAFYYMTLWRPCNFTPAHSLTGPVAQPFASRLGGQRFASRGCTNSQWNRVFPVSAVSLQHFNILYLVEASETRGTTALVYWLINSSLYTGTIQGW
jgi:hypothetical protein